MSNFPIAREILRQLGGNQFALMVGAHSLTASENALSLQFKGSRKWKALKVELTPADLYTVTFFRKHGKKVTTKVVEDVYNEDLIPLFERETGLYCKLFG